MPVFKQEPKDLFMFIYLFFLVPQCNSLYIKMCFTRKKKSSGANEELLLQ